MEEKRKTTELSKIATSSSEAKVLQGMSGITEAVKSLDQGNVLDFVRLANDAEEKDDNIQAGLETRITSVTNCEISFLPADDSDRAKEIADAIAENWAGINGREEMMTNALYAIYHGFSLIEMMPEFDARYNIWTVGKFQPIPPTALSFRHDDQVLDYPRLKTGDDETIDLTKFKDQLIFHTVRKRGSFLKGGLARTLLWYASFAKFNISQWLDFVEIWSKPLLLGRFVGSTQTEEQKREFQEFNAALQKMFSNARTAFKGEHSIEVLETKLSTNAAMFERFLKYLRQAMTRIILGNTETTSSESGNRAKSEAQFEIQDARTNKDGRLLGNTLTEQMVTNLVRWNYGPEETLIPRMVIQLKKKKNIEVVTKQLKAAQELKLPVSLHYIYEALSIPQPKEDEALLEYPAEQTAQDPEKLQASQANFTSILPMIMGGGH